MWGAMARRQGGMPSFVFPGTRRIASLARGGLVKSRRTSHRKPKMTDTARPRNAPWSKRTLSAQAMGKIDPITKGVVPPIHVSTTYIRDPDNQYTSGFVYGRP